EYFLPIPSTGIDGRVHQTFRQLCHASNVASLHGKYTALFSARGRKTRHAEARGWDPCGAQDICVGRTAGFGAGRMFFSLDKFPRPDARLNDPVVRISEAAWDAENHFPLYRQVRIGLDDPLDGRAKLALR